MKLILHRGGATPQNTLKSIRDTLNSGLYDGVEIDINITKDGVVVVYHNDNVSDTTNGRGLIYNFTFKELRKLDAGYKWPEFRGKGYKIPKLSEILELVGDKEFYLELDMKNVDAIQPTIDLLKKHNMTDERIIMFSTNFFRNMTLGEAVVNNGLDDIQLSLSSFASNIIFTFYRMGIKYKTKSIFSFHVEKSNLHYITKEMVDFFTEQGMRVSLYGNDITPDMFEYFESIGIYFCVYFADHRNVNYIEDK